MKKSIQYKEYLLKSLQNHKKAAAYLNAALEENDPKIFTIALKDVVDALGGGVGKIAKQSCLNRESLYKMLSKNGNPRLSSLNQVMHSMGLEIHVAPQKLDHRKAI